MKEEIRQNFIALYEELISGWMDNHRLAYKWAQDAVAVSSKIYWMNSQARCFRTILRLRATLEKHENDAR